MMAKKPLKVKAGLPAASEPALEGEVELPEAEVLEESDETSEILVLQQELSEVRSKADEYLDGWQRSRADLANYRKRMEREQAQAYQTAAGNIIKRYLDVLDDLDRALRNRPSGGDGAGWADGIELIYRKLNTILESEGVMVMQTQDQLFDPSFHEAITLEDSPDHESGQIIEVLKQGYILGDRVLRPALVRVAR
jgi:molecular chaperone GrpE